MIFIQTFWCTNNSSIIQKGFGWIASEYNLISWALSCLQLKHFNNNVILYTNSTACKLLIDYLQLPYTDVNVCLDKFNSYHPDLWALSKVYTYSQQEKPFLHVDGDVYVWKKFDEDFLASELIAQSMEKAKDRYNNLIQKIRLQLTYLPKFLKQEIRDAQPVYCYNAGIFGGKDIEFFKNYCHTAFKLVNKNLNNLPKINVTDFNIFFEQYLFYCMAKNENKKVNVLIKEIIDDGRYRGLGDFYEVPYNKKYLHLIGEYKKDKTTCLQLANRLRQDYPEYYYRIIEIFKKKKIPLFKDYYFFKKDIQEKKLVSRYEHLKEHYKNDKLPTNAVEQNLTVAEPSFRTAIVKETIKQKDNIKLYYEHIKDIEKFEHKLSVILQNFNLISKDYLYARDICQTTYFEYIFKDIPKAYNKFIVTDNLVYFIKSKFDWSSLENNSISNYSNFQNQFNVESGMVCTAIIPECDKTGYSLLKVDELDMLLLKALKKPLPIRQLFEKIKFAFDEEDLRNSQKEFELLIFGRIKNALLHKMIKCVMQVN